MIGAGSGGLGAVLGMVELGFQVLLIDRHEEDFGGECLHTGCIPSKALLHISRQFHHGKQSTAFGLTFSGDVDMKKVREYIRQKQETIGLHENVDHLRKKGIVVTTGLASLVSRNQVRVKDRIYTGRNIIIATGSRPKTMEIPGAESLPVLTNETIFNLDFLPRNFLFIGAGPVSIEIGQAFSRLGSKVHLIVRKDRILSKEDPGIAETLLRQLQEEGIEFSFGVEVKRINNGRTAVVRGPSGEERELPVDAIFLGLGRFTDFEPLKLERAEIQTRSGRILLNDRLQTTNKKVFVCGDAANNLQFSHAAEMHNMLLIHNFISPIKKRLHPDHFPWVTFTDPEVATFGRNEKQLKENNIPFERLETSLHGIDRAVTDDFEYGRLILLIQKKRFYPGNSRILGGSMIAPNAGEISQELVLAMAAGILLKQFMRKIYAYPTAANVHKTLVRERFLLELTPWMKRIMRKWYRF